MELFGLAERPSVVGFPGCGITGSVYHGFKDQVRHLRPDGYAAYEHLADEYHCPWHLLREFLGSPDCSRLLCRVFDLDLACGVLVVCVRVYFGVKEYGGV